MPTMRRRQSADCRDAIWGTRWSWHATEPRHSITFLADERTPVVMSATTCADLAGTAFGEDRRHRSPAWVRADPRTRPIPVMAFASADEEWELVDAHKLSAIAYLQKSASFEQFTKAARRLGPALAGGRAGKAE